MIIDVHTHLLNLDTDCSMHLHGDLTRCGISHDSWRFTPDDHLKATAAADVAFVFGVQAAKTGWNVPNDTVAAHVRQHRQRMIFFAAIDAANPKAMEELERCHQDLGCRGVKLGPIYSGVHPHDPRSYEIYRYCAKHGLPIMTHMATTFSSGVPLDYARPAHMDQVACEIPDLKIILAHLGHPWEGEAIAAIRKQPNLFADLSALYYRPWQFYNSMRLLVEYKAQGKLLFGSDYPATTTAASIDGVRGVNKVLAASGLPGVPETILEDIIHRDSLALLGLQHPALAVS